MVADKDFERLEELTESLEMPFRDTIYQKTSDEVIFKMEHGSMKAYLMRGNQHFCTLFCDEFKDNAVFPMHHHNEMEYVIVVDGEITVSHPDGTKERFVKDEVSITKPGVVHNCEIKDGSVLIAITVPAPGELVNGG